MAVISLENVEFEDYMQANKVPRLYPKFLTQEKWNYLVRNRETNGLAPAFTTIGRTIFVNTKILAKVLFEKSDGKNDGEE